MAPCQAVDIFSGVYINFHLLLWSYFSPQIAGSSGWRRASESTSGGVFFRIELLQRLAQRPSSRTERKWKGQARTRLKTRTLFTRRRALAASQRPSTQSLCGIYQQAGCHGDISFSHQRALKLIIFPDCELLMPPINIRAPNSRRNAVLYNSKG